MTSPMPAAVRRLRIVEELADHEFLRISDLRQLLGVTEVTIRSDLDALAAAGELRRVRGGAMAQSRPRLEPTFEQSAIENAEEKRRIGERAAALIEPGETVLIDVGTTTTAAARALAARLDFPGATVFTNSLSAALELEPAIPRITVVVTGGTLRPLQHSLVDPLAGVLLDRVAADTVLLGCSGVDVVAGVTNVNLAEAEVKRQMLAAARRRIVLADASKVGHVAMVRLCTASSIDVLVTDQSANPRAIARLRRAGVTVELA
jgi:DeoR family transcriptional regulator of aga operon